MADYYMENEYIDHLVEEHQKEYRAINRKNKEIKALDLKDRLSLAPDHLLLHRMIGTHTQKAVEQLNNIAKNFPAGDIALRHTKNGQPLSMKQREALINIYVYHTTGINPKFI